MDDAVRFYGTFTKKDDDKHIVEGFATTETTDTQGEIVRIEAVEKALSKYMTFPTIREMHQWSAVGKTIAAKVDKTKRGLFIKGKIVDKEAWEKVKEKVYNGFSIGGKVAKKVGNIIHELVLNEISLVDRPANPEAVFSLVKFDKGGSVIEKQLPVAVDGMSSGLEVAFPGIKVADRLIAMMTTLTYLVERCQALERPTKHIEKAIKALKQATLKELTAEKVAAEKAWMMEKDKELKKLDGFKDAIRKAVLNHRGEKWIDGYFEEAKKANG